MNGRRLAMFGVLLAIGVAAIFLALQLVRTPPSSSVARATADERAASAPVEVAQLESSIAPPADSSAERQAFAGDGECRMFGLVVDELEQPIAGVTIKLSANDDALQREARTGADGRYELRAPVPGAGACELGYSSEQLFVRETRRLWRKRPDGSLHAGDNDLGRTVLKAGGAIEGRVTLRGTPVPNVELRAIADGNALKRTTLSAADGSYRLGPLALDEYGIVARGSGGGRVQLAQVSLTRSAVETADLALPWASFIAGRVVDPSAASAGNCTVSAKSALDDAGRIVTVETAADGAFCVPLDEVVPHRLLALQSGRRVEFGPDVGVVFEAGAASVELALTEPPHARFRVVDAQTRAPIERFGLRVVQTVGDHGSATSEVRGESHPRGECEVVLDPRASMVQVSAPGYEARELRMRDDTTSDERQVIELLRGATVTGHATFGGKEPSLGSARLESATAKREPRDGKPPRDVIRSGDVAASFLDRRRSDSLDFDGRFRFDDLAPGVYSLTVRGIAGARAPPLEVEAARGQVVDVGEIVLAPGADLHGYVLLPPRASPRAVNAVVDNGGRSRTVPLDATAHFAFDDLVAGACTLTFPRARGALVEGPPIELQLAPGEVRQLTFDLHDRDGIWLVLHVHDGARAIQNARFSVGDGPYPEQSPWANENGVVRWWQPPAPSWKLQLLSPKGLALGQYVVDASAAADGELAAEIEVSLATLVIDWRALQMPFEAQMATCSVGESSEGIDKSLSASTTTRTVLDERRFEVGPVSSSTTQVRLVLNVPSTTVQTLPETRDAIVLVRSITCRPGETIVCAFTDADRVE